MHTSIEVMPHPHGTTNTTTLEDNMYEELLKILLMLKEDFETIEENGSHTNYLDGLQASIDNVESAIQIVENEINTTTLGG